MPQIFPVPDAKNLVICIQGIGSKKDFSVMMTDCITDVQMMMNNQCFPLYWYPHADNGLFSSSHERIDGISNASLSEFISHYHDETITKETMFYYIYGVLSSPEYSLRFGNDTKRELARIPLVGDREKFRVFSEAGRELGMLHVNYESVEEWPLKKIYTKGSDESCVVSDRMRIVMLDGERVIRVNDGLTVSGIPSDSWRYVVNGRSALEWIVERYRDDIDKKTGIRNDCNAWGIEHGDDEYIVRLIAKVTRVSVETVRIIEGLPELGV